MKPFSSSLKALCSACVIAFTLNGCAAAVLGGAALGAHTIADRRSAGAIYDDGMMEVRIHTQASQELKKRYETQGITTSSPEISVISYDRRILLLGQLVHLGDKAYVESVARHQSNARDVFNYIQISPLKRTAADVAHDTWITSKLRARLLNIPGVYPGHVKVATFNGNVYVMGILTPAQQNATTEVIRTTPGVQQVITLYQNYLPNPTQTQ